MAMSKLPNVHVKISMLGYTCPGWIRTKERQEVLKSLVRETIDMFGVNRCMVAWNWHVNGAISDADSFSTVGPDAVELLEKFNWFFEGYNDRDKDKGKLNVERSEDVDSDPETQTQSVTEMWNLGSTADQISVEGRRPS